MASIVYPVLATYVASQLGTADESRVICYLDENMLSVALITFYIKGNVFLDRVNVLIRRYLEAGFREK